MEVEKDAYPQIYSILYANCPAFATGRKKRNHLLRILDRLKDIRTAPPFDAFRVTVEWTRGGTYGPQVAAVLLGAFTSRTGKRTSGCGYDKESTAIADVLNQTPEVLHLFFDRLESGLESGEIDSANFRESIKAVFGYGVGLYSSPDCFFDGGVGTSCYAKNFAAVGWEAEKVASGKGFDVWEFRKGN